MPRRPRLVPLLVMALAAACGAGSRAAPIAGADAEETRAMQAAAGAVTRQGDSLRIAGTGKASALLVDDTTDAGMDYRVQRYDGRIARTPFHGVRVSFYEGRAYLLVHERTARQSRLDAPPVPSPSGRRLAVPSFDLEAQFDPNALTVLEVEDDSVRTAFRVEPSRWGTDSVAWRGEDTLLVVQRWVTEQGPGHYERREALVVRQGAAWALEPPDTSGMADGP